MNQCSTCSKTFEKRPPHGWKRKGEAYYCPECWRKSYVLRAITMKVASPLNCSWDELRPLLKNAWADTTACSNWMMTELRIRDRLNAWVLRVDVIGYDPLLLPPEAPD